MLQAILNKSWRQHSTKNQLYGHLPPITKAIQVKRTKLVGHYWRSRDELISDILLWTSSRGWAKAERPARIYIQLCADTGCSLEDLPEAIDDREGWRERVREFHAGGVTWWWWRMKCCDFFLMVQLLYFVDVFISIAYKKYFRTACTISYRLTAFYFIYNNRFLLLGLLQW